jgi:thiol peroxidase
MLVILVMAWWLIIPQAFGADMVSNGGKMTERTGIVTAGGKPVTLVGNIVKVGERAPDFTVINNDMQPTTLAAYKGKTIVILALPSLDTKVCDIETRHFNQDATQLDTNVVILAISMDLPFAQKRWCAAAGVDRVITLSDYRDASFGTAYGVLRKETRLEARAVFVIDKNGVIRYIQIVSDTSHEPDYAAVLAEVKKLEK